MVEDKKTVEGKTSKKLKATTGAWWKSTIVEEPEEPAETEAAKKKKEKAEDSPVEQVSPKAPRKRGAKKSTPPVEMSPAEPQAEEAAKPAQKQRKRAPRKKKETGGVEVNGAAIETAPAEVAVPVSENVETVSEDQPQSPSPSSLKHIESSAEPTAADGAAAIVEAGTQPAPETASIDAEIGTPVADASETSAEETKESAVPKRTPRKRAPRKKKPVTIEDVAIAGSDVTVEKTTAAAAAEVDASAAERDEHAVQIELQPQATGAVETAQQVEVKKEKSRRPSRSRSNRRKKSVVAEETDKATGDESTTSLETEDSAEGFAESTVESAEVSVAEEKADETTGEREAKSERENRKTSNRRSRGRRRKDIHAEDEPSAESEEDLEEDKDLQDVEDIDIDVEGDIEELYDQEERNRSRADIAGKSGVEIPDLPDEEPEDSDKDSVVLKLLINAEEPEECRLALLSNGRLESIHVSTINRTQTKNNIYKARIVAIEPNLQAAFVDYGTEKNGFLPFSEIHPEYYKEDLSDELQKHVENHHWKRLNITDVVEKGREVLVQVVKEEVGKKGANMTTYLSLPGRSVVLMPGSDSSGISRKISGEERRAQLRTAMNSLDIPEGIGWIVRTASADITKSALARDVGYLLRLWEEIKKKAQEMEGVGQVYEDHQSVLRFLREHFDPAIEEILVDDEAAMEQVKEFISFLPSKQRDVKVRLHKGSRPIFNQFSVEDQIESIYQPRVSLPSGGSIVIEPTEALVSIDVNSGSTSKGKNFDQSIYQANMEAASELARQLRLRDLGGLIVVDFIDMRNKKHIRDVERMVKQAMRRDKAKVDFTRISKFGLMQISRQKLGSPIEAGNYRVCQHCKGRGTVRSVETLALFYLRRIQTGASRKHVGRVECHFPLDVAQYLLNQKRQEIQDHELRYGTEIVILADPDMGPTENEILLQKAEKETNDKKQG